MKVTQLRRYPVKSMLGERLDAVQVSAQGFVGDRAYGLVDVETAKVASAKRPKRWAGLLDICAATVNGTVEISLPDGHRYRIDDPALDTVLSQHFGRPVRVLSRAPSGAVSEDASDSELDDGPATHPPLDPSSDEASRPTNGTKSSATDLCAQRPIPRGRARVVTTGRRLSWASEVRAGSE